MGEKRGFCELRHKKDLYQTKRRKNWKKSQRKKKMHILYSMYIYIHVMEGDNTIYIYFDVSTNGTQGMHKKKGNRREKGHKKEKDKHI